MQVALKNSTREIYVPHDYGVDATRHILDTPRCILMMGMGTGKTVITATALSELFDMIRAKRALIVAPLRVATQTWPDELDKWQHLDWLSYRVLRGEKEYNHPALMHIVNFEMLASRRVRRGKEIKEYPGFVDKILEKGPWPYDVLVIDESSWVKNVSSARYKTLRRIYSKCERVIELTGTPSPNGLMDLWSQIFLLDGGQRLGKTITAFRNRWFYKGGFEGREYIPYERSQKQILGAIKDLCFAYERTDVEPPIHNVVKIRLPAAARAAYDDLEREYFTGFKEGTVTANNGGARSVKWRQVCNGFAFLDGDDGAWKKIHDIKLDALEEIALSANGMPLLVAYQFIPDKERILKRFKRARVLDDNPETVRAWNRGEIPMLIMHPLSGGHGLNLQWGSNIAVWFGFTWALEQFEQFNERIGPVRQKQAGLNRSAFYHYILAEDTLEEDMQARIYGKQSLQQTVKDAMKRRAA